MRTFTDLLAFLDKEIANGGAHTAVVVVKAGLDELAKDETDGEKLQAIADDATKLLLPILPLLDPTVAAAVAFFESKLGKTFDWLQMRFAKSTDGVDLQ